MISYNLTQDNWLSSELGKPCFVLKFAEDQQRGAHEGDLDQSTPNSAFVFARQSTSDIAQLQALQNIGMAVVDTSVTFEMPLVQSDRTDEFVFRPAVAEDKEGVERVARENFRFSRFHLDPLCDDTIANSLKAKWAGNYFNGQRGDEMVVCIKDDTVVGFLQLLFRDNTMVIDLIAAASSQIRKGVASGMISYACDQFQSHQRVLVGTQVANIPSVRLYEKMGFRLVKSDYMLHYHNIGV